MLGFLFGTLCLIGLFKVLKGGRRFGPRGWHGRGPWGHHHPQGGWGHRRHGALRWLFWRLDTTVGQEKLIRDEVERLREPFEALRSELRETRRAAAQAFGADTLDAAGVEAVFQRHEALMGRARAAVTESLQRVHAGLDPEQRQRVARWLEAGPGVHACD
jgi:Spy/CpxP family protein refolding chaperone